MLISKALSIILAAASAVDAAAVNLSGRHLKVRSDAVSDAKGMVTYDPVCIS